MSDDDIDTCPACAEPIDYCHGHGAISDPRGFAVVLAHHNGDHTGCHIWSPCSSCEVCDGWMVPAATEENPTRMVCAEETCESHASVTETLNQ